MLGVYVSVPIACFRRGLAREYLETEQLPPPATCYGFLLSFVGERDRRKHIKCRVAPVLLNKPQTSVVLRTVWRVKDLNHPPGAGTNARPDYQQLLSPVHLAIWLDSTDETGEKLEDRVRKALMNPESVSRFGGLSLGESTHMVDEVCLIDAKRIPHLEMIQLGTGKAFLTTPRGRMTLPVWVDHVGSKGTRYATGDLVPCNLSAPERDKMPIIQF